jgi:hypothetical protein
VTYGAALAAIACFAIAFERLGILAVAQRVMASGLNASRAMRDATASDDEKERIARSASLVLLRSFGSITVRSALAVAASVVPVLALQSAGVVRLSAVNDLLMTWTGLLLAAIVIAAMWIPRMRR